MVEEVQDEGLRDVADTRKEFLEARASIIGATDSPKILNLSRWGTALTVYNDKVNPDTSDRGMSLPAWLGLKMQSTVGELYTEATGNRLRADNRTHRMADLPYIGCHLDFRVWGKPDLIVEAKTRAYMRGWGDENDGSAQPQIPVDIWVQIQHELMVTGAKQAHLAVLFGHHTYRTYVIKPDEKFIHGLMASLIDFRKNHWEPRIPPLPTGHPMDTEIVRGRNPQNDGTIKAILPEQAAIVENFRLARQNAAQANAAEAEAKNRVIDLIAEADGITGTFGTITFKLTKPSRTVHWDAVAGAWEQVLREVPEKTVQKAAALDAPVGDIIDSIHSIYTEEKPGYRRINVQWAEEES